MLVSETDELIVETVSVGFKKGLVGDDCVFQLNQMRVLFIRKESEGLLLNTVYSVVRINDFLDCLTDLGFSFVRVNSLDNEIDE